MKEEDEDRVETFLSKYNDINLVKLPIEEGYFEGTLKGTIHIFPYLYRGEGHFLSQLTKSGNIPALETIEKPSDFDEDLNLYTFMYKSEKCALPFVLESVINLHALRMGLKITNTTKYAKCPFDHALSHYLSASKSIELTQEDAAKYLAGQELVCKENLPDGFYPVSFKKVNLGYVNKKCERLKNCYPKGLRIN